MNASRWRPSPAKKRGNGRLTATDISIEKMVDRKGGSAPKEVAFEERDRRSAGHPRLAEGAPPRERENAAEWSNPAAIGAGGGIKEGGLAADRCRGTGKLLGGALKRGVDVRRKEVNCQRGCSSGRWLRSGLDFRA